MAGLLAARIEKEVGAEPGVQVERAFLIAYGRAPDVAERQRCIHCIARHGLRPLCLALLNSNELIYLR